MNDTKPWYASKGIWGSIIAIISLALGLFGGHAMTPEAQVTLTDQIVAVASGIGTLIGSILAIIGRLTAKTAIAPGPATTASKP